jgi:hypothetical protein
MESAEALKLFKQRVAVLDEPAAKELRQLYIARFVNTESDYFRRLIASPGPQGDDGCYTGYLWDTLKAPRLISEGELLARLREWSVVSVFWDLHTAKKIRVPHYWKFPKAAVLSLASSDLLDALAHDADVHRWEGVHRLEHLILPEDIYITDGAMSASLVLTHEYTESGRWCLEAR